MNPQISRTARSIQAVIADDENRLREALAKQLGSLWPELEVVASVGNGQLALEAITSLRPQIAFLDIRMPGPDGLEVARILRQAANPIDIVFVTAYDEYAVQAFEQHAVDYLLKPIDTSRIEQTIQRLKARLSAPPAAPSQLDELLALLRPVASQPPLRWLRASVRTAGGEEIRLLDVHSVLVFEAADKYIRVLTAQGEALIRMPLKELLERLPTDEFWQIHRGTVIKVDAIKKTVRSLTGKLTVFVEGCDETFEVSRSFQSLFKSD